MYVCFLDDDDLRNIRRQKAGDRYANMPLDKKAELQGAWASAGRAGWA